MFVPGGDLEMLTSLCFALNTTTPVLARLKIGFLYREILDRFDQKIASELSPDRTLWIYSAHDSTIASLLNSIGLFKVSNIIVTKFDLFLPSLNRIDFQLHSPPYASSLLIELYRQKNEFYFQIFYRWSNTEKPLPLDIPQCGVKCSIAKFRQAYKEIIPTGSYEDECRL